MTDHDGFLKQLGWLESLVKAHKVNDSIDALLKYFVDYKADLLPHLSEEEKVCLPLMRAYFSPEDLKPAVMEMVKHSHKLELGSMISSRGANFWKTKFVLQEGIPFFVWYIDFYLKQRALRQLYTSNIQALVDGKKGSTAGCSRQYILNYRTV